MKKLFLFMALLGVAFGADAANDLIISQRKADNSGNIQRNVAPTARGFFTFDASKIPGSTTDLTYTSPTLSVPDAFNISSAGAISFTAGGTSKDITIANATGGSFIINTTVTAFPTTAAASIFKTGSGGGAYPFTLSGNLVLQPRATGAIRDVVIAGGNPSAVIAVFKGSSGTLVFDTSGTDNGNGRIQIASSAKTNGLALGTRATEVIYRSANDTINIDSNLIIGTASLSRSAWGISGIGIRTSGAGTTYTDTTSSGTVASIVVNSYGANVLAASSTTTFTNAANVYIGGDPTAGTNVTLTNSYGLWNVGKTRLQDLLDNDMGSTLPTPTAGATFRFRSFGLIDGLATSPFMTFRRTNGTAASPTVMVSGNNIGRTTGTGWDGSAYASGADIIFNATETWSGSAHGAEIDFRTQVAAGAGGTATSFKISGGATAQLTGGAGNMTITAGTGASRTMSLQTTTSGSTATTALAIDASQNVNVSVGELQTAGNRVGYNLSAYGTGTVYTLTNTAAAVAFGTTSPSVTLDKAGTYLITGRIQLAYTGATVVAETATVKLRRTNNTAADLTSGSTTIDLPVATTLTYTYGTVQIPPVIYTTALTTDVVTIFANVSATLGAGTITAEIGGTNIQAIRLY